MKNHKKRVSILLAIILIIIGIPGIISLTNYIRTQIIDDNYKTLLKDKEYETAYKIDGIELVTQKISCGYAVMEMFGQYVNHNVSEDSLYKDNNNSITTSSTGGFENEMNKVFINYTTKAYSWQKSSDLLKLCYTSLKNDMPVPFEMAYKNNDEWSLHFSLLIGLDLKNDIASILNPYGKNEIMTISQFIDHTSYKVWSNMPAPLYWAFGLGIFDKNTIFIINAK